MSGRDYDIAGYFAGLVILILMLIVYVGVHPT